MARTGILPLHGRPTAGPIDEQLEQLITDGAKHVRATIPSDQAPQALNQAFTFTGTPAAMGSTSDVSIFTRGALIISGLTAETIALNSVVNGVTGAAITVYTTAGAAAAAAALGNGTWYLRDLAVDQITVVKSAAVENATVTLKLFG